MASFLLFIIIAFISINHCEAQTKQYIAMIPSLHSRQDLGSVENSLQLSDQIFVLFTYPNAVAVYSESVFINQSNNFVEQEMALPSTGHDENDNDNGGRISNGILNAQLWIEGERIIPQVVKENNVEWYTIQTKFAPHQTHTIKSLFWAQTSDTDIDSLPNLNTKTIISGKREFLINLAHAAIWNNKINSINIIVVLLDSLSSKPENILAQPSSHNLNDSTLTWSMQNIEPTSNDNIFVSYDSDNSSDKEMDSMTKISHYFVKTVYDKLLYYVSQLDKL